MSGEPWGYCGCGQSTGRGSFSVELTRRSGVVGVVGEKTACAAPICPSPPPSAFMQSRNASDSAPFPKERSEVLEYLLLVSLGKSKGQAQVTYLGIQHSQDSCQDYSVLHSTGPLRLLEVTVYASHKYPCTGPQEVYVYMYMRCGLIYTIEKELVGILICCCCCC